MIPAQLIAAAFLFAIFAILRYLYARRKFDGLIVTVYLTLYSLKRLFLEYIRGDFRGETVLGLTLTQILALGTFVAGIVMMGALLYGHRKNVAENIS
jgi:phosphatidylglycerol:prolipoprotein diacylglycerol transferase